MDYNNPNMYQQPMTPQAPQEKKGLSITSMILGICGLLAWCIPCCGFPVIITGLIMGIIGIKKGGKGMAIAGIILNSISLLLTIANAALGAYLGATGQLYY